MSNKKRTAFSSGDVVGGQGWTGYKQADLLAGHTELPLRDLYTARF